jgi:hypothetical protein
MGACHTIKVPGKPWPGWTSETGWGGSSPPPRGGGGQGGGDHKIVSWSTVVVENRRCSPRCHSDRPSEAGWGGSSPPPRSGGGQGGGTTRSCRGRRSCSKIDANHRGCHSERPSEEPLSRKANPNDPKEIPRRSARNDIRSRVSSPLWGKGKDEGARGCHSERPSEEPLSRKANPNDPKEIPRLSPRNDIARGVSSPLWGKGRMRGPAGVIPSGLARNLFRARRIRTIRRRFLACASE